MAATANPTLGITREELDLVVQPLAERMDALETSVGDRLGGDFVRASEFRLLKWLGTFALAAVLGGFGLLYEQVGDVRVAMERLQTDLLKEIHALRGEMHIEFASVRQEMHAEFASVRQEMHAGFASIRQEMHAETASIREDISGVRERVARVETHMQRGSANDE
ncbi:MAG: hypothetical protein OXH09_00150 [Gammaproteobacteria bacterium]|nr:hypothetical protein [Gammaproteobacteria bacterium]